MSSPVPRDRFRRFRGAPRGGAGELSIVGPDGYFDLTAERATFMSELVGSLVLRARREVDIIDAFKYLVQAIPYALILTKDRQVATAFKAISNEASRIVSDSLGIETQLDPDPLECLRKAHKEAREALKNANYTDFKVNLEKLAWCLTFIASTAMAKRGWAPPSARQSSGQKSPPPPPPPPPEEGGEEGESSWGSSLESGLDALF